MAHDGSGTRGGRADPRVGREGGHGEASGAAARSEVHVVLQSGAAEGCVGRGGGVAVVAESRAEQEGKVNYGLIFTGAE